MTHALTDGTVPDVIEQPSTDSDGARIYGTTLPPSKKIPVKVRFWREDEPEVWAFNARPKLEITTLRRVGGLMQMAEIQQVREQRRTAAAQAKARAQQQGQAAPAVEDSTSDALPVEVLDSVGDILQFVGGMMS